MNAGCPFCISMRAFFLPIATTAMLRSGNQIRLTRREAEIFKEITNFEPSGIRTLDDLQAYIFRCKRHYHGTSHAARFLHWLIDEQFVNCVTGQATERHAGR